MTHLTVPMAPTEKAEAILEVFQAATHPLTPPQAEKLYRGPKLKRNELRQIVDGQLLMEGKLFRCSPSGKSPRYWAEDEAEKVREKLLELLAEQDLDEKKLVSSANKALPKISNPVAIKNHLQTMHREGLVHERAGKGKAKTKLVSLRPFSPFDAISFKKATLNDLTHALSEVESLGGDLDRLLQILTQQLRPSKGMTARPAEEGRIEREPEVQGNGSLPAEEDRRATLPREEIDDLILKGMHDLDSAVDHGASVLLRDLRRHMPPEYRGHDPFDTAILDLADGERIVLHRHDQPSCLTEMERDELVRDENGTYYVSVAKRV